MVYLIFALYASTAFGRVFVMRHLKLATISVLYSVSMVLLLTAVGVVLVEESLNYYELAGIVLASASLVQWMRFAVRPTESNIFITLTWIVRDFSKHELYMSPELGAAPNRDRMPYTKDRLGAVPRAGTGGHYDPQWR